MVQFSEQSETWLQQLAARRNRPIKDSSLDVYKAYLTLIPCEVQLLNLEQIDNATAKLVTDRLVGCSLAPATIREVLKLFKRVVASAIDANGNELFARKWNGGYIDVPAIMEQSQPVATVETIENIQKMDIESEMKALVILLAGTGCRLGECLSLKHENVQIPGIVQIRTTLYRGKEQPPKTKAANRVIDLPSELSNYLSSFIAEKHDEYLFPYSPATLYRKLNSLPGFHSLRRFRITHLETQGVPRSLIQFWAGHASSDITSRYIKLQDQLEMRKTWCEKAGLGFKLI
jgi:integrase